MRHWNEPEFLHSSTFEPSSEQPHQTIAATTPELRRTSFFSATNTNLLERTHLPAPLTYSHNVATKWHRVVTTFVGEQWCLWRTVAQWCDGVWWSSCREGQQLRVWDEDEQCWIREFGTLNKGYGIGSINNRGIKWNRPRSYPRPKPLPSMAILKIWRTLTCYRPQLSDNRSIKALIGFSWIGTRGKRVRKISKMSPRPYRLRFRNNQGL